MSECLRCGRDLIDQNAKYGWRCLDKVGIPYGKDSSFTDYFPELKKQYDFLSNEKKKKYDKYLNEMLEKLENNSTSIEGAGMYLTITEELKKDITNPLKTDVLSNRRLKSKLKNGENIIRENSQYIKNAAKKYGVNPSIIAGCIYTEQVLNVDWKDNVDGILAFYDVLDTSIGVGQVKMSTAKLLEDLGYITKSSEYSLTVPIIGDVPATEEMIRAKRLENNEQNIEYVSAYLKYWQDKWKEKYPEIDGRSAILGALYNLGKRANSPNSDPKPNAFGNAVKENYYYMQKLLELD